MANENQLVDVSTAKTFIEANWPNDPLLKQIAFNLLNKLPRVDAVEVEKYKALLEMYHDLRENFIDYVCSGTCNVAPYCLNRCEGCVDRVGWCSQGSDECHGFNPAEIII